MNAMLEWQGLNTMELFKEFYSRVYQVKRMIMQGVIDWAEITDEEVPADVSERDATRRLASYLKAALNSQMEYVASNTSALEFAAYQDVSYVMSALADEIFLLEIRWFGAQYWHEFSIEAGVFSTSYAGDEYYRRLGKLLNKDVLTTLEKKLAAVFILSLQLGFRGRLRGNEKLVRTIRKRLLPKAGYARIPEQLFPSGYGSIINPSSAKKLEPFSDWHKIVFGSLMVYLAISSAVWWWLTSSFFAGLGAG